uniref:flavoprotein n=1 Tax=Rahnella sp. RFA10(1/100) TaxID=2511202 RepID=UPI0010216881|nr:flavoprotein [Rahnella sp. RFA10(1/100)]
MTPGERQRLSRLIDRSIAGLLVRKRAALKAGGKTVRVLISGDDLTTLPMTLQSLRALDNAGYALRVAFSHSASQSGLKAALLPDIDPLYLADDFAPLTAEVVDSLYLPALSTNSLSKIALGIRDNLATVQVFHALSTKTPVIVTLNPELMHLGDSGFAPPLQVRLEQYIDTLRQYGIAVTGSGESVCQKRLITLNDIRLHRVTDVLRIGRNTLITPAAQDEIRRQNITVIR